MALSPLFSAFHSSIRVQGVSHSELAAAVTNGGGLGVIGGLTMTPTELTKQIKDIKDRLHDKNGQFGVDLAIPQVGGNARKTNHDYTHGNLPELIDVIVEVRSRLRILFLDFGSLLLTFGAHFCRPFLDFAHLVAPFRTG
jgi:hypothetical protein